MSNICKNKIEITGNKNNLKKIEDILNQKRKKSKINFFNELCGDKIPMYDYNTFKTRDLYDFNRFGAEDIKFNEIKYKINDEGIKLNFKTNSFAPIQFLNQLALEYEVSVKATIIEDFYFGDETFIINYEKIKKELGINSVIMNNNKLKNIKFSEEEFIELILDELINSETINDIEYELAKINTNFEKIQDHCTKDIIQVLNYLSNIENLELDEIITFFGFDVTGFVDKITIPVTKPQVEIKRKLLNYLNNKSGTSYDLNDIKINFKDVYEFQFDNVEHFIIALMIASILHKYNEFEGN